MGEVFRLPMRPGHVERAAERLDAAIRADRERERHTVELARAAVLAGRFDDEAVRAVLACRAGGLDDHVELCELMKLVSLARRHCGLEPGT